VFEAQKTNDVQLVAADQSLLEGLDPGENQIDNESRMPDFRGLTIREAMKTAKSRSIDLRVSGSGWAVSQVPAPGSVLGDERLCKIVFEMKN